jgi:hypothetical protein
MAQLTECTYQCIDKATRYRHGYICDKGRTKSDYISSLKDNDLILIRFDISEKHEKYLSHNLYVCTEKWKFYGFHIGDCQCARNFFEALRAVYPKCKFCVIRHKIR